MKKKLLSLLLCICLCISLVPAVCLNASAGVGFSVYVAGENCGIGTTTLSNGQGTVTVDCISNEITVTLDNCHIGTSKSESYNAENYACGFLFIGDANEQANLTIVLKGYNEILPSFFVRNAMSLVITSVDDGSLTVCGAFRALCGAVLKKTDLTVTGENTNAAAAFYSTGLTIDEPAVKGGGSLDATKFTVKTHCIQGVSTHYLTINGGETNISAKNLGILLMPFDEYYPRLIINGGITNVDGEVAALYLCTAYGDSAAVSFAPGMGDVNGNIIASTESYEGFCKQSWISPDEEYPLGFFDADGNIDFYYDYDLMSNAAKSVCIMSIPYVTAVYDCGEFGLIGDQTVSYQMCGYGEPIGALPVPTNKTFVEGKFNNMYFEGWAIKGHPGEIIDETYVLNGSVTLEAVWAEGQISMPFTDVKQGQWFCDATKYCYGQKLISGTTTTTFSPMMNCSRAMIVSILYRLEGQPEVYASNAFSDVDNSQWYAKSVVWASENGIVAGDGKGHFMPNQNVTREQLALIMMKYADYTAMHRPDCRTELNSFPDNSKVSSWAKDAVSWAVCFGILSGKGQPDGKTLLDPSGTATRAEFASILMRYIQATQNATLFFGDVISVPVPEIWQGNIICHKNTIGDECFMTFYCKKEYEATNGLGGKLFGIVTTKSDDYLEDPTFDTYLCSVMNQDHETEYKVYRQRNTDVQCDQPLTTPRGACFYSMLNARSQIGLSGIKALFSEYKVSYGLG